MPGAALLHRLRPAAAPRDGDHDSSCARILAGKPITIFGDGSMRRDFTHVDDIVRGVLAAIGPRAARVSPVQPGLGRPGHADRARRRDGPGGGRDAGGGHARRVPLGDVDATFADITRAKSELGWEPRVKLEDGLATVVGWLKAEG